jgi:hypothetical protein
MTAGRTARELWRTNRESSSVDLIPPRFSTLISLGGRTIGPLVAAFQTHSLTPSTWLQAISETDFQTRILNSQRTIYTIVYDLLLLNIRAHALYHHW